MDERIKQDILMFLIVLISCLIFVGAVETFTGVLSQTKERNLEKKINPRKINNQNMFGEMSVIRVKYRELESEWIEDVEMISGEIENWIKLQSFIDNPKIHFNKDKYGWRGRIKLFGYRFEHRMSKDDIRGIGSSPNGKNKKEWVEKCVPFCTCTV